MRSLSVWFLEAFSGGSQIYSGCIITEDFAGRLFREKLHL